MSHTNAVRISCVLLLILALAPPAHGELTPMERLGKLIFFDTDLSTPAGVACAACHGPEVGFTGPISEINAHGAVYPGAVHTRFGNRKPPASAYVSFSPDFHYDAVQGTYVGGMFWDGRALNTVAQAQGPPLNPLEMNNPNKRHVVDTISRADYADLFREVFGADSFRDVDAAYVQMAEAVAAFEASSEINQFSSKYDLFLAGAVELTPQEAHGLELFEGQAHCSNCHPSRPDSSGAPPLFTDYTYDNLGVPKNPENPFYGMPPHFNPAGDDFIDYGLGKIVNQEDQMGKMKVPTLRNVAKSPYEGFVHAYSHTGFFKSLNEIVDFYNTRDVGSWPPPEVPENVNHEELGNLGLSESDVDDVVAFLGTLSDGYEPEGMQGPSGPASNDVTSLSVADGARIRFVLSKDSPITLRVFDVSGRPVRTLMREDFHPAGAVDVRWDGTDGSGARVASGIYFYRLQAGSRVETRRIVWVR